ncbi:LppP/LprE family lipoprotein [Solirubrobacter ginsenosidimutans]|uniref:LppP/LprE family lipoprotein n=1 Tax=Solirubrobacter ginsenosidimutans TaxID=490573 RepID=A0A9X3MWV8_9ACTN|nr:LppP/LprE family lipoprotein [Solirubrobacter ginsenosidimutans]MDA0163947.1 LppP/LprE family lipoprotein [Solirubrobacter ginsenosidimutans]
MPPRRKAYRWTRRIAGLIATLAFIGVGVAIASMVMPDKDSTSAAAATPTATPAKHATKKKAAAKKKPAKPKGPTKAEREALKAAIAVVRQKGYTTLKPSDYHYKSTFRVLIGRPVGDSGGGSRAFFFIKDQFLGNDALNPSTKLSVSKAQKMTVTLTYGVYAPGDTPGSPSQKKRVRFRLEGTAIHALDTIPLDSARFQRPKG